MLTMIHVPARRHAQALSSQTTQRGSALISVPQRLITMDTTEYAIFLVLVLLALVLISLLKILQGNVCPFAPQTASLTVLTEDVWMFAQEPNMPMIIPLILKTLVWRCVPMVFMAPLQLNHVLQFALKAPMVRMLPMFAWKTVLMAPSLMITWICVLLPAMIQGKSSQIPQLIIVWRFVPKFLVCMLKQLQQDHVLLRVSQATTDWTQQGYAAPPVHSLYLLTLSLQTVCTSAKLMIITMPITPPEPVHHLVQMLLEQ